MKKPPQEFQGFVRWYRKELSRIIIDLLDAIEDNDEVAISTGSKKITKLAEVLEKRARDIKWAKDVTKDP